MAAFCSAASFLGVLVIGIFQELGLANLNSGIFTLKKGKAFGAENLVEAMTKKSLTRSHKMIHS